jgi:4-diphosphocytidyl-2-C-methyl-D-erythritol kinase
VGAIELAPGKVNLCLLVGAPRADGYHPLVSLVQPTALADELRLVAAERDEVVCPGVSGENLALTAIREFRARTGWDGPPVRIEIAKRIPIAGGMAGGSSDAAAALRLLAKVSGLPIPKELPMALGADVTVMLHGQRALMTGAGEHVEALPRAAPALVVIPLAARLSAAHVYREFDARDTPRSASELEAAAREIRAGRHVAVNDLEPAARRLCPLIDPALEALREAGAEHAMVSGSGPTVFGIGGDLEAIRARYPQAVAA